ncbi:hypothetical protein BHE74_00019071 [Ensete ventricosum]|nr:hypothetical protein BHE74_00019071 [Ensete ventricosum]
MVSRAGQMSSISSHSKSRSVKISAHRSRVSSCPSRDSRSVVVVSSFGVGVPGDFGTVDVLAAMRSCFNVDSTMTTRRLVEVRKNYFVPLEYEPHAPLSGEHPYGAFSCGFSLSTYALEVVRLPATKAESHAFSSFPIIGAGAS